MPRYKVVVEETVAHTFVVYASSEDQAERMALASRQAGRMTAHEQYEQSMKDIQIADVTELNE